MKNIKIPLTEDEIKAIQAYSGYKHTKINIIADLQPEKIKNLSKKGWDLEISREELKKLIEEFINIYSVIYKQGEYELSTTLYRGTTKDEVKNTTKEANIKSIYSTSLSEDISKTFTEYQNGAIIRTRATKGLPTLYIETLKEDEMKNEEEVLILPFAKVKEFKHASDWIGYSYYDMVLEKDELPEIENTELESLKEKCLNEFEQHMEDINIYNKLNEEVEWLYNKMKYNEQDRIYIYEDIQEKMSEIYIVKERIKDFSNTFNKMLKGLCRQKEIEIDNTREEIKQEIKRQKEQKEKERIERLKKEIQQTKKDIENKMYTIENSVRENIQRLEENANKYSKLAERLGINYTQNPDNKLQQEIIELKEQINNRKQEILQTENENIDMYSYELEQENEKLKYMQERLVILNNIVENHNNQSLQEIKYNLNVEVRNMISKIKLTKLEEEKNQVTNKKDNIFHKLVGRNKIKEEKLKNMELRKELICKDIETMNPENKVSKMLEEIYVCAYEEFDGNLSSEMEDMINKIRSNFGNLPQEDVLINKAKERINGEQLIEVDNKKTFFKTKTTKMKEQNEILKSKLRKIQDRPARKQKIQIDTVSNMVFEINNIKDELREDRPSYQQSLGNERQ